MLPEALPSPQLTAQWETELTAIAKGQADPEGFMAGIAEMTRGLIANTGALHSGKEGIFRVGFWRCGEMLGDGGSYLVKGLALPHSPVPGTPLPPRERPS